MEKYKIPLFITIVAISFLGWLHFTHAAVISSNTVNNGVINGGGYGGTVLTGNALTVRSIELISDATGTPNGAIYGFTECTDNTNAHCTYKATTTENLIWTGATGTYLWILSTPVTLNPNYYYGMNNEGGNAVWGCDTGTNMIASFGGGGSCTGGSANKVYYYVFYDTATPYGASINWVFPQQGTTTAPFNYLSAQITGLNDTSTYVIQEATTYNGKTIVGTQLQNTGAYFSRFGYVTSFPIIYDNGFGNNFGMVSTLKVYDITQNGYLPVVQLPNTSSTISWTLIPYIHEGQNETNGTTTIRDTTPVWIQATSTNPVTTPWDGTIVNGTTTNPLINGTSTNNCVPSNDPTALGENIAYGICYGWNFLVQKTNDVAGNLVSLAWTSAKQVFPFSVPLTLYDEVTQNASTTLASTTDAKVAITLAYGYPSTAATSVRTLILISSSTNYGDATDEIFAFQVLVFDLIFILIVFWTIRHELTH